MSFTSFCSLPALTHFMEEAFNSGLMNLTNSKVFCITNNSAAATIYGVSSTLVHYSIFIGAATLTSMVAAPVVQCFSMEGQIQKEPSMGLIINLEPLGIDMLSANGTALLVYPLAWGVSAIAGRAIAANLVKEGPPLSYREIALLELARVAERFTAGL